MTIGWKIYWAIVATTVATYLTMVLWSLPLIAEMADGRAPFDMRPGGYSFDEAMAFLNAIDDVGRDFYLDTQQFLDSFYPALFVISVAIPLAHLMPRYLGWPLAMLAIGAGTFDYLENGAVAIMLSTEPDELTETMVSTASTWTLAKSILTTVVSLALVALLCVKAGGWLKSRGIKPG